MRRALERVLADAMDETLQTMFFIVSEPEGEQQEPEPHSEIEASVEFSGDMRGRLRMRIGASEAAAMACDFLGLDEVDATPSHMTQVVGELANMICGSALSRLRPEGAFRIAAPVVAGPGLRSGEFACEHFAGIRNGPLTAWLEVEG